MATTQPSTPNLSNPALSHQNLSQIGSQVTRQAVHGLGILTQPLVLAGIAANAGAIAMAVMHGA